MTRARWTDEEVAILRTSYPTGGLPAVRQLLPHRSKQAIYMCIHRLQILTVNRNKAPEPVIAPGQVAEIMALVDQGWSNARLAQRYGVSESSVTNAVVIERGRRKGYRPLPRDQYGHLTADSVEALRLMLRKGMKGVEIQERAGVSAACVAEQRRKYRADLKARKKAPLPEAGGGIRYSGRKLTRAERQQVEQLYMQGLGRNKIHLATGLGETTIIRIPPRL